MVCLRNRSVDTLHVGDTKGDDYDDDDDDDNNNNNNNNIFQHKCSAFGSVKTKLTSAVIGSKLEKFQNHSDNSRATYRESRKLRNRRKRPYCALHTRTAGSADVESTKHLFSEITLHVAWTVYTEQL